ncbi:sensor histidine kinase [Paenibacillus sp. GbtcB18]|uniref:sensor histidine kinase n=1 Tax=Paenibacillus sp. GbtcB18 TaxID=2824763 RepID=UPI001C3109FB|nr:histidine kinase [Paenibacillus sp. GbtcB18]
MYKIISSALPKAQQKIAQYEALKSQINPHFLANALETVQMKAIINGQRDISEMVGILGKLFRIHIQTGKRPSPCGKSSIRYGSAIKSGTLKISQREANPSK